jgi:hypothetical protein
MQAPETIEIAEATEIRMRGACLISGCTCKDVRIVSYRRAAFFAAMARRSGQTAVRVIALEPDWRIPSAKHRDQPAEVIHTPASA